MYIEFRLPNGAGGMAAGHACAMLRKKISEWAEQNGNPTYKAGVEGAYRFRLTFEDEYYYTLFSLSFKQGNFFSRFEIIQNN
jgi:hypothetical protein